MLCWPRCRQQAEHARAISSTCSFPSPSSRLPPPQLAAEPACCSPALHLPSTCHRKKEALQEKELGNEAYKKKQFDEAITHYDR